MFSKSDGNQSGRCFVKICGVCNLQDAALCAALGVDAIGMLLTKPKTGREPGSDRMDPADASNLVAALPAGLRSVLLVHTVDIDEISSIADQVAPDALQIQGSIPPEALLKVRRNRPQTGIIKSFRVPSDATVESLLSAIGEYLRSGAIDAVILDSKHAGGGEVHDWSISASVVARLPEAPILLAGGLTAANVGMAQAIVRPFGVDVMSGVNSSSRDRKDPERLKAFVEAARAPRSR
jgi:phosphoribosylanthranilate isomerase